LTKTDVIKMLQGGETNRAFLSENDVRRAFKIGQAAAKNLLAGLDYLPIGNSKKYLLSDIAERAIAERRR